MTINNTDILLHKHGATSLVAKNRGGATHMSNGIYYAVLDATDTNTLGNLVVYVHVAGALPVKMEFKVVYSAASPLLTSAYQYVDLRTINAVAKSVTDLKDFADTEYDPATHKVQGVVLTDTVTNITNGVTLADDAITSAKFDESTAYPLKSADTGATAVARTGADSDTLETLSDQISAIDISSLATASALATHDSKLDGAITDITFIKDMEGGRWKIINNQMIFYKSDNTTEVARFNLFKADVASQDEPDERKRV